MGKFELGVIGGVEIVEGFNVFKSEGVGILRRVIVLEGVEVFGGVSDSVAVLKGVGSSVREIEGVTVLEEGV